MGMVSYYITQSLWFLIGPIPHQCYNILLLQALSNSDILNKMAFCITDNLDTNNIVFTLLCTITQAKFHLSSANISGISLFDYVIYSPADAHCIS